MLNHYKKNQLKKPADQAISLPEIIIRISKKTNRVPMVRGNQYSLACPAHEDKKPSLGLTQASDGKILMHCQAGCSLGEICDAIGIKVQDLFPNDGRTRR